MKKDKLRCLYVVDHPKRDMPAYVWWASNKNKSKFINFLISTSSITCKSIKEIKPDAIIWCYARPQNSYLMRYSYLRGIKNIIHDTEGINYNSDEEYSSSCDNLTFRSIHAIWCWGSKQEKLINNRCLKIGHKLLVSNIGSIRYEYYKNLKYQNKKDKKILINTNFPIINPKYGSLESDYKIWVNIEKKLSKIDYLQRCIDLSAMRQAVVNFVYLLLDKDLFKPESILLRPHPYESENYYKDLVDLGIKISLNRDISHDISQSFLLAQCGCQTVLDGLIQGVPSILIKPNYKNIWADISESVNIDYLEEITKNEEEYIKFKNKNIKKGSKLISPYLTNFKVKLNNEKLIYSLFKCKDFNWKIFIKIFIYNSIIKSFFYFKESVRKLFLKKNNGTKKLDNEKIIQFLDKKNIDFKLFRNKYIFFG